MVAPPYDIDAVRRDFPILEQEVNGHPLVYLDSAASSQRPLAVLDAVRRHYKTSHANVHRGAHELSARATEAYEDARACVAAHIGAEDAAEIVFVRGTTEAINLVASSWGKARIGPGDEILLTKMEHHSNIVPWQLLAEDTGATLRFVDVSPEGRLVLEDYGRMLSERTRLVGVTHISNSLGVINPVREIAALAHEAGALCLVDGAQAAPHLALDMGELGCDFYAFSGHKMCGPTGIGALWARRAILEDMPPYQGGGEMIASVTLDGSTWAAVPHKFESSRPERRASPVPSASVRRFAIWTGSVWTPSDGTRRSSWGMLSNDSARSKGFGSTDQPTGAWVFCLSRTWTSTRTTWRRSSIRRVSRSGPVITAINHSWSTSESMRPLVPVSTCTTRLRRSTPSAKRSTSPASSSAAVIERTPPVRRTHERTR